VATEIAKGCSQQLAERRVLNLYGHTLPSAALSEGAETLTTQFMKCVDEKS
jgi:hypothetical protein